MRKGFTHRRMVRIYLINFFRRARLHFLDGIFLTILIVIFMIRKIVSQRGILPFCPDLPDCFMENPRPNIFWEFSGVVIVDMSSKLNWGNVWRWQRWCRYPSLKIWQVKKVQSIIRWRTLWQNLQCNLTFGRGLTWQQGVQFNIGK